MTTTNNQGIEVQLQAAASVQLKISAGMALLKDNQIHNLILREGYPVEGETVSKGEICIVPSASAEDLEQGTSNLSRDELKALAFLIANDWETQIKNGGIDGIILGDNGTRFRANIFLWGGKPHNINDQTTGHLGCMIRIIPTKPPTLESLNLPSYMRVLGDANYGLLLVVGPTGAGKTSTVAAYIEHINQTRVGHIIKIEDPIEYIHEEQRCRITSREIGSNVSTFETGVKDAMRELPLAIAVGEIRNQETLVQTLRAAHSGHYVTATRHAPNLVSSIRALVDDLPGDPRANAVAVSEALLGVVFQVRVPGLDGKWHFVHEVMNITNSQTAKELIAEQKWPELRDLMRPPRSSGSAVDNRLASTLNENLAALIVAEKISPAAADRRAYDRANLIQSVSALKPGNLLDL